MREQIIELLQDTDFKEGKHWERKKYGADGEIVTEGEQSDSIYLIEKGCVRVLGKVALKEDRQVQPGVCDLGPGDVFGELSLFDDEPRSATVRAISETTVIRVDGLALMEYLKENPEKGFVFLTNLLKTMVGRLRQSNQKVLSLLAWGLRAHNISDHI